jgi:hypothetical protein
VLLRPTSELAQILTVSSGEKFWVKLTDLPKVAENGEKTNRAKGDRAQSVIGAGNEWTAFPQT